MKVVVQKVSKASVEINNKIYNEINKGLMILVGFTEGDDVANIKYLVNKILNLRIFNDENGVMNKSILDVGGEILSISQFTLYADTTKGNRPSYIKALKSEYSEKLYDTFNDELNKQIKTKTGIFGSNMKIKLENVGPTTIIMEK